MTPMYELDALITMGWADVRRSNIPANWREIKGPGITGAPVRHDHDGYVVWIDPLEAERLRPMVESRPDLDLAHQVMLNEKLRTLMRRRLA